MAGVRNGLDGLRVGVVLCGEEGAVRGGNGTRRAGSVDAGRGAAPQAAPGKCGAGRFRAVVWVPRGGVIGRGVRGLGAAWRGVDEHPS